MLEVNGQVYKSSWQSPCYLSHPPLGVVGAREPLTKYVNNVANWFCALRQTRPTCQTSLRGARVEAAAGDNNKLLFIKGSS